MNNAIILLSHGDFADACLNTMSMIIGKKDNVYSLTLKENDLIEDFEEKVRTTILELLSKYDYVLAICDILGGSPYNALVKFEIKEQKENFVAFTGLNLGLAIELSLMINEFSSCEMISEAVKEANRMTLNEIKYVPSFDEDDEM